MMAHLGLGQDWPYGRTGVRNCPGRAAAKAMTMMLSGKNGRISMKIGIGLTVLAALGMSGLPAAAQQADMSFFVSSAGKGA